MSKINAFLVKHDDPWEIILTKNWGPGPVPSAFLLTFKEIVQYLQKDPANAALFPDKMRCVCRGAGEGLNDFWWGDLPSEEANQEGLTASAAVTAALTTP